MGQEESEREEAGAAGVGRRGCDFCGEAAAVVYCRADAARLCLECDRRVHAANSVSSQHQRALLCDGCRAAAAAFLCSSAPHRLLLCSNCDFDAHRGCDGLHDRRPVEPFSGCPSALELASIFGVGADEKSAVSGFPGKEEVLADDGWMWEETSPVLTLEDLIVPTTSHHGFQAMGIPPWPKNRNLACGKHKEEILRQLQELIKPETHTRNDHGELQPINEFQPLIEQHSLHQGNLNSDFDQDATSMFVPNSEATALQWNHSDYHEAADRVTFSFEQLVGSSSLVTEQFLEGTASDETSMCHASGGEKDPGHPVVNIPSLLPKGGVESGFPDRDSVISRYKEKRKTRRYDKLIRYESRKARADSRTRIKGRFAKANQL